MVCPFYNLYRVLPKLCFVLTMYVSTAEEYDLVDIKATYCIVFAYLTKLISIAVALLLYCQVVRAAVAARFSGQRNEYMKRAK